MNIVKSYNDVSVRFNEEGWLNATHLAEKYGRDLSHWVRSQETVTYINALKSAKNAEYIETRRGRTGGTWLHPKLAVVFARWLDPAFAVWCDSQIDDIVRGKSVLTNTDTHLQKVMAVVAGTVDILSKIPGIKMDILGANSITLIEQQTGVDLQQMRLALPGRSTRDVPMNVTELAHVAGVDGPRRMNRLLADCGLQSFENGRWVPTAEGETFCDQIPFTNPANGHTGFQLMWRRDVLMAL